MKKDEHIGFKSDKTVQVDEDPKKLKAFWKLSNEIFFNVSAAHAFLVTDDKTKVRKIHREAATDGGAVNSWQLQGRNSELMMPMRLV